MSTILVFVLQRFNWFELIPNVRCKGIFFWKCLVNNFVIVFADLLRYYLLIFFAGVVSVSNVLIFLSLCKC